MSQYAILRFEKLKTEGHIKAAQNHNDRSHPPANADPNKANRDLHGSGDALEAIKSVWQQYNIKPRKNAVRALEYVLTGSPDVMNAMSSDELNEWADESINFLKNMHGQGLVRAWLHLDESTAHIHALVTPILEKTVRGKRQMRLCSREFNGGKQVLSELQTDYANHVKRFGLKRGIQGSTASHKAIKTYYRSLLQDVRKAQKAAEAYQVKNDEQVSLFNFKKVTQKLKTKIKTLVKKLALVASEAQRYKDLNQELHQRLAKLNFKYKSSDSARLERDIEQLQNRLKRERQQSYELHEKQQQQQQHILAQRSMIDLMRRKIKSLQRSSDLTL